MDTFFRQYLDPYTDRSRPDWSWRQNTELARTLSPDTLRIFQRAAEIRDAYFQTGGNMPFVQLTVKPPILTVPGANVRLEIGGMVITGAGPSSSLFGSSQPQPSAMTPVLVQWPGASLRAAISASAGSTGAPSVLERIGPWSMFRLLEAGSVSVRAETATASFVVGGYETRYEFTSGSSRNPLNLAALRDFKCPSGI